MVNLRLYLENIAGDWFGWIEDYPGVFAQGATTQEVERSAPRAFSNYLAWLTAHGEVLPADLKGATSADFTAVIADTVNECAVTPWTTLHRLPEDLRPLRACDFERYLRLLSHARADLSDAVHAIPPHEWDTAPLGEQSIRALLQQIGQCETSLLEQIGIEPTVRNHPDPWVTLLRARIAFESVVQDAFSRTGHGPAQRNGDLSSLARVLRLTIWNERRATKPIAVRSNPMAYLKSVSRSEIVIRQRDTTERTEPTAQGVGEAVTMARHTHASGYYY